MKKPDGYDQSEAKDGVFKRPSAGPCILGVTNATTQKNKNQEQQLVLFLDIAEGEFKNFYRQQGERFNKKQYLRFYQNTEGKSLPHFKGIVLAFEESNQGFKFDFDESTLVKRRIGANLREEEYVRTKDGAIGTNLRVAYLCSVRSVVEGKHKVLPIKKLARQEPGDDDEFEPPPQDEFDQRASEHSQF
jgi:hypothetical protein